MVLLVDAGNSRLKWAVLDAAGNTSAQQARAYGERPALGGFYGIAGCLPGGWAYYLGACIDPPVCRQRAGSVCATRHQLAECALGCQCLRHHQWLPESGFTGR